MHNFIALVLKGTHLTMIYLLKFVICLWICKALTFNISTCWSVMTNSCLTALLEWLPDWLLWLCSNYFDIASCGALYNLQQGISEYCHIRWTCQRLKLTHWTAQSLLLQKIVRLKIWLSSLFTQLWKYWSNTLAVLKQFWLCLRK